MHAGQVFPVRAIHWVAFSRITRIKVIKYIGWEMIFLQ